MNDKETLSEIREAYVRPQGLFGHYGMETRAAEFDRMIAEVERAAAESAWDEGYQEANQYLWRDGGREGNPYRAEM